MIIKITDKCTMECSHCMFSCKATNNNFMTEETLDKILATPFFTNSLTISISGGEPTEHPHFFEMLEKVLLKAKGQKVVTVMSNGLWGYIDGYKEMILELLDQHKLLYFQVTNDPEFYPYNVKFIKHEKIFNEEKLRIIDILGRAKNLDINQIKDRIRKVAPNCYNFKSVFKKEKDLVTTASVLEQNEKFCHTLFEYNGDYCPSECGRWITGNVHDKNFIQNATAKALETFTPCNECGIWDKTAPMYKMFLGL